MKQLRQGPHFAGSPATQRKMGTRQNGFVLILVIMAVAAIGAEMFILTDIAKTMLFESNTAYLEACSRNLAASGLAWAERNSKNETKEIVDKTIKLDVTNMDIRGAALSVIIGTPRDKEVEVQINTFCNRGRRTLSRSGKYRTEHKQ